ncbi:unnamed protein product, partial [Iphiclides podalirius]
MSEKEGKTAKRSEPQTFSKLYLISYNTIQTLGWSYLLWQSLVHFLNRGTLDTYWEEIKWTVIIFQNAAVLEVLHAALRLVPSGVFVVLMQVYSRVFLVCGVLLATPGGTVSPGLPLCILAWSITEIVRYAYYAVNLVKTVPQPLLFSRYSTFLVLYPLGITGELLCMSKWGHGLTADVNDYVDNTVDMLVPFIQSNGLDPMNLPEVIEGFEVKPLLITYSAWLKIYDGTMKGLVNLSRSGDQKVNYFAKMLRVRVELQFKDLEINYKYLVKVMNLGPTGGIVGSLSRFVVIDILIDFNNDEVQLQQFSLTDIGRLRVRLTGNILVDWLINPVINIFLRIFDTVIMKVVEVNIRSAVQSGIDFLNTNLQDAINHLESFN